MLGVASCIATFPIEPKPKETRVSFWVFARFMLLRVCVTIIFFALSD